MTAAMSGTSWYLSSLSTVMQQCMQFAPGSVYKRNTAQPTLIPQQLDLQPARNCQGYNQSSLTQHTLKVQDVWNKRIPSSFLAPWSLVH